jgi:hypothetical protein
MNESFLVLFYKKERFFLKPDARRKEAKTSVHAGFKPIAQ